MKDDLIQEFEIQEELNKKGEYLKQVSDLIHDKRVEYSKNRELKLRKFKRKIIGAAFGATTVLSARIGYKNGNNNGYRQGMEDANVAVYTNSYDIYNAPDELLVEWAYAVRNQKIENDDIRQNCQNVIESYTKYYNMVTSRLDNMVLNNENSLYIKEYSEFKYQINMLDDNLATSYNYQKYSFDNSLYSKSQIIDGMVYVPYSGNINDIPDNSKVINVDGKNKVFVPSSYNYKYNLDIRNDKENSYSK